MEELVKFHIHMLLTCRIYSLPEQRTTVIVTVLLASFWFGRSFFGGGRRFILLYVTLRVVGVG